MTVSDTLMLTLLVTGSLSFLLIAHAVIDLYRHGMPDQPPEQPND